MELLKDTGLWRDGTWRFKAREQWLQIASSEPQNPNPEQDSILLAGLETHRWGQT